MSWWTSFMDMKVSLNGNMFRVIGPLRVNFTGDFPKQRPVARSIDVFFDLRLNKRLSKQSRRRWFETSSRSLWRHRNEGPLMCPHRITSSNPGSIAGVWASVARLRYCSRAQSSKWSFVIRIINMICKHLARSRFYQTVSAVSMA